MTVTDLAAGGLDRPEPGPVAVEESGAATVSSLLTSPDFDTYAVVLQTARQAAVALGAVVQDAAPGHIGTANIGFSVFERLVAVRRVTSCRGYSLVESALVSPGRTSFRQEKQDAAGELLHGVNYKGPEAGRLVKILAQQVMAKLIKKPPAS